MNLQRHGNATLMTNFKPTKHPDTFKKATPADTSPLVVLLISIDKISKYQNRAYRKLHLFIYTS